MKSFKTLVSLLCIAFTALTLSAQVEEQMKLDNLRYYLSSIKDNIQNMRYYADSAQMLLLLDRMEALTIDVDDELNKIVIPEPEAVEDMTETMDTPASTTLEDTNSDYNTDVDMSSDNQASGIGISKFIPFGKKMNTSLFVEFGINALHSKKDITPSVLAPEINTAGSWYWHFGLKRTARIGGSNSKVAFNYGVSYLINRLTFENDVRLSTNASNQPEFVHVPNVKDNPKLNIGYINIPLTFSFSLSKKTKLHLGGYAGYRIHTVQKLRLKVPNETIHEHIYAR
ncbi:MAG: hypothetical protein WAU01_05675, partial [Saprospiraceae bacterium]